MSRITVRCKEQSPSSSSFDGSNSISEEYKTLVEAMEECESYVRRRESSGNLPPVPAIHNAALMKMMLGGIKEAETDLRRAIDEELKQNFGKDTPCLAVAMRSLAVTLSQNPDRGEEYRNALEQAQAIWGRLYGSDESRRLEFKMATQQARKTTKRLHMTEELKKLELENNPELQNPDLNPAYPAIRQWSSMFLILTPQHQIMSIDECQSLIQYMEQSGRLEPALTTTEDYKDVVDTDKNDSEEMSAKVWEHPILMDAAMRLSALTGKFNAGGHHAARYDYSPSNREMGLQGRLSSFQLFLNQDFRGGATYFPRLAVTVIPRRGRAIWFGNKSPVGDAPHPRALYESIYVASGTKYMVQFFVREKGWKNELIWGDIPPISSELNGQHWVSDSSDGNEIGENPKEEEKTVEDDFAQFFEGELAAVLDDEASSKNETHIW
eukprot:jgi/Bigna1/129145/aug1.8_g3853